jgi:small basic protein
MIWLPFGGLVIGFLTVYWMPTRIPSAFAPYLSVATLAGLDSIFGGIRAGIEGKFHDDIFITGFAMNAILAAALVYLGVQIGADLYLAAVVALGGRVFLNLSLIRRYWLTQTSLRRRRDAS